jgi:hypothetical protein
MMSLTQNPCTGVGAASIANDGVEFRVDRTAWVHELWSAGGKDVRFGSPFLL